MSNYAIIALGGKQYRVREGEKLLVDRVSTDEGKTWHFTRDIDTEPGASFAYTSVLFAGETAILTYYRQTGQPMRLDLRLRRIPIGWFYRR